MTAPVRIQRQRTKGWRMPENTVYVGRGTKWGNPFRVGDYAVIDTVHVGTPVNGKLFQATEHTAIKMDPKMASDLYRIFLSARASNSSDGIKNMPWWQDIRREIAGKNLACWCPPDQPCHADVLLEIANQEQP